MIVTANPLKGTRLVCRRFIEKQLDSICLYLSRDMTKPAKWLCAQRRLISAWASAQSDQSLRCPHEESLGP